MKRVVVITGASSGFGLFAAIAFAKRNYTVIAAMRNIDKKEHLLNQAHQAWVHDNIIVKKLDVTNKDEVEQLGDWLEDNLDGLHLLINNAGLAVPGMSETLTENDYRRQFETNFFGVISVTNRLLPLLRQTQGKIINISSISGRLGFPGLSAYVASKHALEGYSESLRHELRPLGVDVSLIQPGSFATNIWDKADETLEKTREHGAFPIYQSMVDALYTRQKERQEKLESPDAVVNAIVHAAETSRPPMRYPVGKGTRFLIGLKTCLPARVWEFLIQKALKTDRR